MHPEDVVVREMNDSMPRWEALGQLDIIAKILDDDLKG